LVTSGAISEGYRSASAARRLQTGLVAVAGQLQKHEPSLAWVRGAPRRGVLLVLGRRLAFLVVGELWLFSPVTHFSISHHPYPI
jgi:hypothetical protein